MTAISIRTIRKAVSCPNRQGAQPVRDITIERGQRKLRYSRSEVPAWPISPVYPHNFLKILLNYAVLLPLTPSFQAGTLEVHWLPGSSMTLNTGYAPLQTIALISGGSMPLAQRLFRMASDASAIPKQPIRVPVNTARNTR
jgi:hypothetical protein